MPQRPQVRTGIRRQRHGRRATVATLASELVRGRDGVEQTQAANLFLGPVQDAIDALHIGSKEQETWEQNYRDILSLPIWQRRHELYAVWIGAKIATSLKGLDCQFHVEDGVLRFPFSGAQLATMWTKERTTYMFWTELRSRLSVAAESGRKSIQPDYRILRLPFDPIRGTVLVVECKQYRRSLTRNFAAALNDYAVGCPNAQVILVNNGPIGNVVLTAVKKSYRSRTRAFGSRYSAKINDGKVLRVLTRTGWPPWFGQRIRDLRILIFM
jgi:hypothetical protein